MNHDTMANQVVERLFSNKRPGDIPYILCRRPVPRKLSYKLHDSSWEGLSRVTRNGKSGFEIDRNFNLVINEDGTCLIPDTEFNRKRLALLSKPRKTMAKRRRLDFATMQEVEEDYEIIEPPTYERVDENIIEKSVVDRIADQVRQKLVDTEVGTEIDDPGQAIEKVAGPSRSARPDASYAKAPRRGRPKKTEKADLLSPIGRSDDDE